MLIEIKNHNIIEDSEIEIKPLTIFLGENGTYKSYIAQLIYCAVNFETVLAIKIIEQFQNKQPELDEINKFYTKKFKEIIEKNLSYKNAPEFFLKDSRSIWQYLTTNKSEINDEIFSYVNIYRAVYLPYFRSFITYLYETIKKDNDLINLINQNILSNDLPYKKVVLDFLHILRNIQEENSETYNCELLNKLINFTNDYNSQSIISNIKFINVYIKKYSVKNTIFIIEEPEISLHPKAQISFFEILLDIVNMGGFVLLITHSDYIFAYINNLIMKEISRLSTNTLHHKTSFYLFKKINHKIKIKNLVDNNGHISDENFIEILDKMIQDVDDLIPPIK